MDRQGIGLVVMGYPDILRYILLGWTPHLTLDACPGIENYHTSHGCAAVFVTIFPVRHALLTLILRCMSQVAQATETAACHKSVSWHKVKVGRIDF